MIWFSSDWHLGHRNIAGPEVSKWKDGYRNFESVEDMDFTIIDSINAHVQFGDTLYFLGDFCLGSGSQVAKYRGRILVEDLHFIKGNHDRWAKGLTGGPWVAGKSLFKTMQDVAKITHEGQTIFMSHYGHRVWPHSHKGCIHLYGHSHNNLPSYGKSMDVGVDAAYAMFGEWRPFSFDEVIKLMHDKTIEKPDHHGHREGEE